MKEKVLDTLNTDNKVFIKTNMWLLEFTNICSLWKELELLEAPTRP
jgi:hypothetical protein